MNPIWLQIFMVMIGGNIIKYMFTNLFIWVCADLAVFGISYLILRRYPFINLKPSMLFLGGLTAVSVLNDLNIINGLVANILIIALLGWMMFGRNGSSGSGNRPANRHKWHK